MEKQRSPIAATLLSVFIPFYNLYWFYVTAKIMAARGAKEPRFWMLWAPTTGLILLVIITLIVSAGMAGSDSSATGVKIFLLLTGLVLFPLMLVLPFVYYYRFSQAAEHVTNQKIGTVVGFVLFLFVAPVAIYLIQEALNQFQPQTQAQAPIPPMPTSEVPPSAIPPQ